MPGHFQVELINHPRYIDEDKCIACGKCAEKCPKKVSDPYNMGLVQRRAAYVAYDQAVPLKYAIDGDNCIWLTKGKCGACKKFCPTGAVDFDQKPVSETLEVGAVVLAHGFQPFEPGRFDNYQYANLPNVVTSMEFERILSASGPFEGHIVRPSDHQPPKKSPGSNALDPGISIRVPEGTAARSVAPMPLKRRSLPKNTSRILMRLFFTLIYAPKAKALRPITLQPEINPEFVS